MAVARPPCRGVYRPIEPVGLSAEREATHRWLPPCRTVVVGALAAADATTLALDQMYQASGDRQCRPSRGRRRRRTGQTCPWPVPPRTCPSWSTLADSSFRIRSPHENCGAGAHVVAFDFERDAAPLVPVAGATVASTRAAAPSPPVRCCSRYAEGDQAAGRPETPRGQQLPLAMRETGASVTEAASTFERLESL